ncbi:hypothetical protein [Phyllobacterium sp. SB3]|uniref:hypothetical protein n=1 Tax=Phyllobacterium sp. SB3 TaxID=3156073 RepID=UPI0032AF6230
MTKKHYIMLASAFKRQTEKEALDRSFYELAADISDLLKQDNPRFDRPRFMSACGF